MFTRPTVIRRASASVNTAEDTFVVTLYSKLALLVGVSASAMKIVLMVPASRLMSFNSIKPPWPNAEERPIPSNHVLMLFFMIVYPLKIICPYRQVWTAVTLPEMAGTSAIPKLRGVSPVVMAVPLASYPMSAEKRFLNVTLVFRAATPTTHDSIMQSLNCTSFWLPRNSATWRISVK